MEKQEERNLVLRIIEFCLNNKETTLNSLYTNLNLHGDESDYLRNFLINWGNESAPNHILTIPNMQQGAGIQPNVNLQLLPNAIFSYIDHLEIVQARRAAKEAKRLAWIAIWISLIVGGISLLLGALQLYFQLISS
jgi:hypothetical protein